MNCKHCGGSTKCINSRQFPARKETDIPRKIRDILPEGARWRRYRCLSCTTTTDSIEVVAPE
jgi:hypothetical protein